MSLRPLIQGRFLIVSN